MKTISYKIAFEELVLEHYGGVSHASEIEIESSAKELTDYAKIHFPKNGRYGGIDLRKALIKGKKCTISLGYDGDLEKEFEGYLTNVKPEIPFQLKLQDEMWILKQSTFSASYEKVSLKNIVNDLLESVFLETKKQYKAEFLTDFELGKIRYNETSAAEVLNDLKTHYGIAAFFKNGKLCVGTQFLSELEYGAKEAHQISSKDIVSSNLEYLEKDDRKIAIKAISLLPNGKKLEVQAGDKKGEIRTLHFRNIETEKELKALAERELPKFKISGYSGSFTTFGYHKVKHGDKVYFQDDFFEERSGLYRVQAVLPTSMGQNGFKRKIHLGEKLSI